MDNATESDKDRFKVRLIDGNLYDPWEPSGPVPSPETIGYGLMRLNRYSGATTRPYSVAEHSLWVATRLACMPDRNRIRDREQRIRLLDGVVDADAFLRIADRFASPPRFGEAIVELGYIVNEYGTRDQALRGLLHDAPEGAGLVDLPSPVGRRPEMKPYKQAHVRCTAWLFEGWGITPPYLPEIVDHVDKDIPNAERAIRPLGSQAPSAWVGFDLAGTHDLSAFGEKYVFKCWVAAYRLLRGLT